MTGILSRIAMTLAVVAVIGTALAMFVAAANSAGSTVTCHAAGRQVSFTPPTKGRCIWILHLKLCYPK